MPEWAKIAMNPVRYFVEGDACMVYLKGRAFIRDLAGTFCDCLLHLLLLFNCYGN